MARHRFGFLLLGFVATTAHAQAPVRQPHAYMKRIGFSDAEIAGLDAGGVAARIVPEKDDIEASVVGVVRIGAGEEALVEHIRRIETFQTGDPVLQIGRFSNPPVVEDLRGLEIEAQDLDDLSKCRVGDCDVKVGTKGIALAAKVGWKQPDARAKASQLVKEALVEQVRTYLEQGSSALAVYNDNDVPESVAAELDAIFRNSPNLMEYNPEFLQYLIDFPKTSLPGAESFVYWCKQRVRRPVVSLVQVCLQKVTRGADTGYFIAMKDLYDSHYFRARAEFLTLVPREDGKGFYLVHYIRARIDPPRKFRGMLLGKIKGAMKDALEADLKGLKVRLEAGR